MPLEAADRVTFTQEEQERCRESFLKFDLDRSGAIDQYELRQAMELYGIKVSDEELFAMISEVDQNSNGVIDYSEYVEILLKAKERQAALGASGDLTDAFVACGGNSDCTGNIEREALIKIVKEDFGLTIDIQSLIEKFENDAGQLSYEEFRGLLTSLPADERKSTLSLTRTRRAGVLS